MKQFIALIFGSFIALALIITIILWPFAVINAGHRGVVVEFGKVQDNVLSEGFHIISPLQNVKEYDIRTQKIETEADAASKDLQSVSATIAVNLHVNPDLVPHYI